MSDNQELVNETLEQICQRQYEEIERKSVQVWDLEEEIRVLNCKISEQQQIIDQKDKRILDLETWCAQLQTWLDKEKQRNLLRRILLTLLFYGFQ